jgi:hypothetical protein
MSKAFSFQMKESLQVIYRLFSFQADSGASDMYQTHEMALRQEKCCEDSVNKHESPAQLVMKGVHLFLNNEKIVSQLYWTYWTLLNMCLAMSR